MKTYAVLLGIPALLLFIYTLLEIVSILRPTHRKKLFTFKLTCLFSGMISVCIILMIQEPVIKDFDIFRLIFAHEKCGYVSYILYKFLSFMYLFLYTPIYSYLKNERLPIERSKKIHALKSAYRFHICIGIAALVAGGLLLTTTILRSAIMYGPDHSGALGNIARRFFVP